MTTLALRCTCGAVRGELIDVVPGGANRVTCYCDDCQAYGAFLLGGRPEDAPPIMDKHGGTTILQVHPRQVRITGGQEHVRLLRLSERGLLRLYAGCCNTPLGNTIDLRRSPFIGVPEPMIEDHAALDPMFGPAEGIQGRYVRGGCPPGVSSRASFGLLFRSLKLVVSCWLSGGHTPSPFFDANGKLVWTARILTPDERRALP